MRAKFLEKLKGWNGDAKVFELDPPLEYERCYGDEFVTDTATYVIVSAVNVMYTGDETYIFKAKPQGDVFEVADWVELPGSARGTLDHNEVLNLIGYEVIS